MRMKHFKESSRKSNTVREGRGLASSALSAFTTALKKIPVGAIVNTAIDALPVELHLPGGYQYCGPGTKLTERLARKDPGINKLDQACKEHDIAYSNYSDTANRSVADKLLADRAWQRVKSTDATIGERAAALAVAAAMKTKTAIGGGRRNGVRRRRKAATKKGGSVRNKRSLFQGSSKKKTRRVGKWRVTSSGKGLYLRPYRNA